jgi:hypothetical protein
MEQTDALTLKITRTVVIFFCIAALFTNVAAYLIGVGFSVEGTGYLQKLNWSLYPIFFLFLGLLIHASWALYINAWKSLPIKSLLYKDEDLETDASSLEPLIKSLNSKRVILIVTSVLIGLVFTVFDAGCLWFEYGFSVASQCTENDFSNAFRLTEQFPQADKYSNGGFVIWVYILQ